jgi:hypothetical protein
LLLRPWVSGGDSLFRVSQRVETHDPAAGKLASGGFPGDLEERWTASPAGGV